MMSTQLPGILFGLPLAVAFLSSSTKVSAATANFNFSRTPAVNYTTNTFNASPPFSDLSLTQSGAIANDAPTAGALNANNTGLCAWYNNNSTTTAFRCNSAPALGGSDDSSLGGFTFKFNKFVLLKSFDISQTANIQSGNITFSSGANSKTFNFNGNSTLFFDAPFKVQKETEVSIVTSGTLSVSASGNSGLYRLNNLEVVEEVPGPLPALGVLGAFGWSRKLRAKLARNNNK